MSKYTNIQKFILYTDPLALRQAPQGFTQPWLINSMGSGNTLTLHAGFTDGQCYFRKMIDLYTF